MSKRRVVVTGMGMLTPLGLDVKSTWQNVKEGVSGIKPLTKFDASEFSTRIAGTINGFDVTDYMPAKNARKMDTFIQYGIAAAQQAIENAGLAQGLEDSTISPQRVGVAVGSGIGGLDMIEANHKNILKSGPRKVSPFFVPGSIINMISGNLSIQYGFKGPNISIVTACTTGVHNIGVGARMVSYGDADVMVVGGAEAAATPLGLAGFCSARAVSTRNGEPEKASRPWDVDRDGFVLSDGAGVMVLEEYEHAKQRGATIYAELAGFGMSGDAYHMTSPPENGEGAAQAMKNALSDAELSADQIDYVNAHGTSTPAGDIAECRAARSVFADHVGNIAMSSTKSMMGHLLGAAGSVESIISVLAINDNVAPPTINLDNPEPECEGINLVPHQAQDMNIEYALCNSFGFGGTNGSIVFKKI